MIQLKRILKKKKKARIVKTRKTLMNKKMKIIDMKNMSVKMIIPNIIFTKKSRKEHRNIL